MRVRAGGRSHLQGLDKAIRLDPLVSVFFFNDPATTEIYPLSLHDALPISRPRSTRRPPSCWRSWRAASPATDRKSTRLNSSHLGISYAVFCLKKKNTQ